ncbi:hypothetical protein PCG10_004212 [Penicillium crustosum]|uniref:Uncharacterized protein n=1 Tax=Penicillium crustosum TaxID=36656 RepID=A0A9P5L5P8_PENCR|nr:uncharacterized protein N7487_005542 [Penicillium crustosum]KAF7526276.1 hypothetical protein PCG10_004212 [Penicillium crustosum]KAJ5411183.1 hypothetical protein N7487_005542 [Penicillium crustosum]
MQLEIDVLTSRQGISPFRLALAVDNLTDLIDQLRVIKQYSATMYKEMPRCRTVRDRPSYYGHRCAFLAKTHKLQRHLVVFRDNLMSQYSNQHWIARQIEAVDRYLDL